jgi:hypothetical protein
VETQKSISQWAEKTFGPVGSNFRVAVRAAEEMVELLRIVSVDGGAAEILVEAADVAIVLSRLADRLGFQVEMQPSNRRFRPAAHIASHANTALATAISLLSQGKDDLAVVFVNEVFLLLHDLAKRFDADLSEHIGSKMKINRQRQWKLDGSGHGYHVREKA